MSFRPVGQEHGFPGAGGCDDQGKAVVGDSVQLSSERRSINHVGGCPQHLVTTSSAPQPQCATCNLTTTSEFVLWSGPASAEGTLITHFG